MKKLIISSLFLISLQACRTARTTGTLDDGRIQVTFLQVNDVYEIAPLEGGRSGGFARVATLKKQELAKNFNTFLLMAGDFLSPSVYNSLKHDGVRIRGKQMVEAMNAAGMDLVVFGNHEFDITESELQSRINESAFQWIASNTFHKKDNRVQPFIKTTVTSKQAIPETFIINVKDHDGTEARIGFIGITLPFNKAPYVSYSDPLETAVKLYDRIKDSCDAVIALTHQLIADDILLAQRLPALAMIIGGHEHDQRYQKVGNVVIAKAHANAKSVYVFHFNLDKTTKKIRIKSDLVMVDEKVPIDPSTDSVVKKWSGIAEKNYASIGFDPNKIVLSSGTPLDGREAVIRSATSNLTESIVAGMEEAAPLADVAIVNSGSIRVDDILQLPISQYDILRSLPFGGSIMEADMKGSLLIRLLEAGIKNRGIGGFLHYSSSLVFDSTNHSWNLEGKPLLPSAGYRVALTDFLLTGGEANMSFLTKENPEIIKVYPVETAITDPRSDIRLAVIRYLEKRNK
jgi:2',3'-cyclic-nucleotide 2'-phosphodiesterase (5'-nucleotidase family)